MSAGARVKQPAQATLDKTIAIVAPSRSEAKTQKLQTSTQATSDDMLGLDSWSHPSLTVGTSSLSNTITMLQTQLQDLATAGLSTTAIYCLSQKDQAS